MAIENINIEEVDKKIKAIVQYVEVGNENWSLLAYADIKNTL